MTVPGFIDEAGRPRLLCRVVGPGPLARKEVALRVDTGADRSVLMPRDAELLGLHRPGDALHILGSGFGGPAVGTREWVSIGVREEGVGEYRFLVNADVPPGASALPSVLGRDVLDRCRLVYDPMNGILGLDVWRSDDFVPR